MSDYSYEDYRLRDLDHATALLLRTRFAAPHGEFAVLLDRYLDDGHGGHAPVVLARDAGGFLVGWATQRAPVGVFVAPEHRRRGVGAELLRRLLPRTGEPRLYRSADPSARRMFERAGVREWGTLPAVPAATTDGGEE